MKKEKAEPLPLLPDVPLTKEEKEHQYTTLTKYRESKIIPSIQETARKADVATGTVISFFSGNSSNDKMRIYLRVLFAANFKAMPADITALLAIWDRTPLK